MVYVFVFCGKCTQKPQNPESNIDLPGVWPGIPGGNKHERRFVHV